MAGIVADNETHVPLTGVNVYVPDKTGTFTDEDGYFILSLRNISRVDSIHFSFIGYQEKIICVSDLKDKMTIFLEPKILKLGNDIVVTGKRENLSNREIKTSVTQIPLKEIERYNSFDISDVFKTVSSVRIEGNDLDGRTIQIRGSNSDEVNVYVDGIMLNGIGHNEAADLSLIPVEDLKEITVNKGGNLLLTGQGAFGGVVNISTRRPSQFKFKTFINSGSYESKNGGFFVHIPIQQYAAFKYYFNYSEFIPVIEYFPDEKYSQKTENENISTIKHHHNASLNFYTAYGRVALRFYNYHLNYYKPSWRNNDNNWLYSFRFQGKRGIVKNFELALNQNYEENRLYRDVDRTNSYEYEDFLNRTNVKLAKKIEFNGSYLQWVADYYHDELNSKITQFQELGTGVLDRGNMYDNQVGSAVVMTFNDHHPRYEFLKWSTYLGFRGDVLASGESDFSKAFGGNVDLELENARYKLFFNHGNNVKYPSLIERVYLRNFQQISLQDTILSPIKPEYLTSYQIGIEGDWKNISRLFSQLSFSMAIFHNDTYNSILKRPLGEIVIQDQTGRSSTEGIELSFQMLDLFEKLDLSSGFLGMNISNRILYAFKPRTNLFLQLSAAPSKNFDITGRLYREGESYGWFYDQTDTLRTQKLKSFWDMDVSFSGRLRIGRQKLGIKITGSNILDAAGFSSYYLNKRFWQFGLWFEI